jgi:hypothetical protein
MTTNTVSEGARAEHNNIEGSTIMKSRLFGALCAYTFTLISYSANAVVIDFEGRVPAGSEIQLPQNYFEDGYTIQRSNDIANPFFALWSGNPPYPYPGGFSTNGTDILVFGDSVDFLSIFSSTPGELFTLQSIDLAMVAAASGSSSLRIEAQFQAGKSISDQLTVTNNWQTFSLPNNFVNMAELRIFDCPGCSGIFGMDNLVIQTVPIPPALWLFGSGLIGLVGMARRKAVL